MRALKYGRWNATLAPRTANVFSASREKNHTTGTPSRWTYVLTFSSWDLLKNGSGGAKVGLTPHMVNGVMPTHARPSWVSTTRGSGISGRSSSAGTGQCINRSEPQFWCMIGDPDGRVLTERRSTPSIGSRLTSSDSALAGGGAERPA